MKQVILSLTLLFSMNIFACDSKEALISATIIDIDYFDRGRCTVYVANFDYYHEHILCPLSKEKILNLGVTFNGNNCNRVVGESLDGVIIDNGTELFLD